MVYGSQKYAVRIQLDPKALATRGIGIDEVSRAVQSANVNLPTGMLYGPDKAFTVQASGQLTSAAAYRPLMVAYRDGNPVRLDELGRCVDSVENDKTAAWYIDQRAVVLAIQRQPGTNTVEVARRSRSCCPPSSAAAGQRLPGWCSSTARSRSASRSTTSSSPCSSPWSWWCW